MSILAKIEARIAETADSQGGYETRIYTTEKKLRNAQDKAKSAGQRGDSEAQTKWNNIAKRHAEAIRSLKEAMVRTRKSKSTQTDMTQFDPEKIRQAAEKYGYAKK